MQFQLIYCHPLVDSYGHALCLAVKQALQAKGHEVQTTDLYDEGFEPAMTVAERQSYFRPPYDASAVAVYVERLQKAEGIVFCFPQWWYSMPAMLKGYVDRVWGPGIAFEHLPQGGIRPLLTHIRVFGVVTTYGSPWWVTTFGARDPGRALLMRAIRPLCARRAQTLYLAHYDMDRSTAASRARFLQQVRTCIVRL